MAKYIIQGGKKLSGKVKISGNKNSVLPCLAASLLTEDEVVLKNVPQISDVETMLQILQSLGATTSRQEDTVTVQCKDINSCVIPSEMSTKLRASILLVGPMLARCKKVKFGHPGGDVIGRRGIELHLEGFRQLGCSVEAEDRQYFVKKTKDAKDVEIFFGLIATVTGTENLIMASVLRDGKTTLRNAACEPHVVDLCHMLNKMGAKISGIGTPTLVIDGVKSLNGTEFTIGSDGIEFGTYSIAAAVTNGEIEIFGANNLDMEPITWALEKMGVIFQKKDESILVKAGKLVEIPRLITNEWPGFPTDMMSVTIVLATQAKGVSLLHDWMYESRMFFVDKLISMGANITIADPHRVLVSGPTSLYGRNLETPDIRAGMALVLAALVAKGESVINRAELIERGYENMTDKLTSLGADIQRVD